MAPAPATPIGLGPASTFAMVDGSLHAFTQFLGDIVAQHDGVVVLGVTRAVEKNDIARTGGSHDRRPRRGMRIELHSIAALELRPLRRVMLEPAAQ